MHSLVSHCSGHPGGTDGFLRWVWVRASSGSMAKPDLFAKSALTISKAQNASCAALFFILLLMTSYFP